MKNSEIIIPWYKLFDFGERYLTAMGCTPNIAAEVAQHLVDSDLSGVYSHGIFRLTQYSKHAREGRFDPCCVPYSRKSQGHGHIVDGNKGFGIPAMRMAVDEAIDLAKENGTSAIGVVNVGHTGRIGAFAERAAESGCLSIIFGGGAREDWKQVVPFGGAKPLLPTNPYAFGMPGGNRGPIVLDFATAAAAGGKIYSALSANRKLPHGLCVDKGGNPTTKPEDYFDGGALLPMGGPKGYGMALFGELLGGAVFGQALDGLNWICICIDLNRFSDVPQYQQTAEACLAEIRSCPPAPGFSRVEVPGERERDLRNDRLKSGIPIPKETLAEMNASAANLGVDGV